VISAFVTAAAHGFVSPSQTQFSCLMFPNMEFTVG